MLTNKLVMACQGIPACRSALTNPSEDLASLVNNLQSAIVVWEKENSVSQTFFTDRRYYRNERSSMPNRDSRDSSTSSFRTGSKSTSSPKAKCYVCQKEGCRSWKHSPDEKAKAKEAFKSKFSDWTKGRYNRFESRIEDRFRQYIAECEDSDDSEGLDDALDALCKEEALDMNASVETDTTYITTLGSFTSDNANLMSSELADRAFSYIAIVTENVLPTGTTLATKLDIDSITYNSTTKLQYGPTTFQGIIIDTGAAKRSIASYGQV